MIYKKEDWTMFHTKTPKELAKEFIEKNKIKLDFFKDDTTLKDITISHISVKLFEKSVKLKDDAKIKEIGEILKTANDVKNLFGSIDFPQAYDIKRFFIENAIEIPKEILKNEDLKKITISGILTKSISKEEDTITLKLDTSEISKIFSIATEIKNTIDAAVSKKISEQIGHILDWVCDKKESEKLKYLDAAVSIFETYSEFKNLSVLALNDVQKNELKGYLSSRAINFKPNIYIQKIEDAIIKFHEIITKNYKYKNPDNITSEAKKILESIGIHEEIINKIIEQTLKPTLTRPHSLSSLPKKLPPKPKPELLSSLKESDDKTTETKENKKEPPAVTRPKSVAAPIPRKNK
jgi:hypothetical protein